MEKLNSSKSQSSGANAVERNKPRGFRRPRGLIEAGTVDDRGHINHKRRCAICVFRADRKNKMATPVSNWLRFFFLFL